MFDHPPRQGLSAALGEARRRTHRLWTDLNDEQLTLPLLEIVNPVLWEVGHVAWFQEFWVLRHLLGEPPIDASYDTLYDSARVAHDRRWSLPLPNRAATRDYLDRVFDRVIDRAEQGRLADANGEYVQRLVLAHEDFHAEAMTYTRQTMGYPGVDARRGVRGGGGGGDVFVPGGTVVLGAAPDARWFFFDNEKWAHPVEVAPFRIDRCAVTCGEFLRFVEEGGYRERRFWTEEGWAWRIRDGAEHPVYWRRRGTDWEIREFERWKPLDPSLALVHVNAYEAEAWCAWRGRRLPSEAEWELAAAGFAEEKPRHAWGDRPANETLANLDGLAGGVVPSDAHPDGASPFGCLQMDGNVWEWTATRFHPFPGFAPDAYREYSEPWFATPHRVLRGGSWATPARIARTGMRNFYPPHRRDVFAGFRSCESVR